MGGGGVGGSSGGGGASQLKPKWPNGVSQLKHIFSQRKGYIMDTPENRRLIEQTVMDRANLVGKKMNGGSELFAKMLDDGRQVWVEIRNGLIQDCGINDIPRSFWPGLE